MTRDAQIVFAELLTSLGARIVTGKVTLHVHQGRLESVDVGYSVRLKVKDKGVDNAAQLAHTT